MIPSTLVGVCSKRSMTSDVLKQSLLTIHTIVIHHVLSHRSCAAWTLICTVTVLLAAATMGVNILHPGAGLGQQLALSGKNRALAEVRQQRSPHAAHASRAQSCPLPLWLCRKD